MPMNVASLAAKRHTITIEFPGDEKLTVTYRPSTIAAMTELIENTRVQDEKTVKAIVQCLIDRIISWDLVVDENDATPYPTDYEHLIALEAEFVGRVFNGIMEADGPNGRKSGGASPST